MSLPSVSVIIPTFDRPALAERAVRSVLAQTHRPREIIIVDDASAERYAPALGRLDPAITVLELEANRGPAGARNAGLRAATSELVAFLDDDDEYLPSCLGSVASALAGAHRTVGLCWTGVLLELAGGGGPRASRIRDLAPRIVDRRSLLESFLAIGLGHGVAVRRECFLEVGGFSEELRLVEDTEWFLRFLSRGYTPMAVPGVFVTVHCHRGSRLTSVERDAARLRECEVVLDRMAPFLAGHPYLRVALQHAIGLSGRTGEP